MGKIKKEHKHNFVLWKVSDPTKRDTVAFLYYCDVDGCYVVDVEVVGVNDV